MSDKFKNIGPVRAVESDCNAISSRRLELFDGGAKPRLVEQILYRDQGVDFMRAVQWLAQAPDNYLIKFTGGCLKMSPEAADGLYEILIEALDGGDGINYYEGSVLGGATISVSKEHPEFRRPSVPEVVPLIERIYPRVRALGVVPAANSKKLEDGSLLVTNDTHAGTEWEIKLDPYQQRALLVSEDTEYIWDAEGNAAVRVRQAVDMLRKLRGSVLIAYDGGVGTRNEIEGWLNQFSGQPLPQVILIKGGDLDRTTDALAHNQVWLRKYAGQVHVVEKSSPSINAKLRELGAFRRIGNVGGAGFISSSAA